MHSRYFGKDLTNENMAYNTYLNCNNNKEVKPIIKRRHISLDKTSIISLLQENDISRTPKFGLNQTYTPLPLIIDESAPLPYLNQNPPEYEYEMDILISLIQEEQQNYIYHRYDYLQYQTDLTPKARAILINWLYDVYIKFDLSIDSLYLSIQIFDRFLCKERISKDYFQLCALGCLLIASKVQEVFYPQMNDWLFSCNHIYTEKQIEMMEILILKTIDYNLLPVYPFCFFKHFSRNTELTSKEINLGYLMLEIALFEHSIVQFDSYIVALAVIFIITKIRKNDSSQINHQVSLLVSMCSGNINEIRSCSRIICSLMDNIKSCIFKAIYQKYSTSQYDNVTDFNMFI